MTQVRYCQCEGLYSEYNYYFAAFGAEFKYSQHSEELVVGSVYLRIYNSNPTFALEDPKRFTVDLLDFIKCKQSDLVSVSMFPTDSTQQGELALTSLAHVIRNNAGVEMQVRSHSETVLAHITFITSRPSDISRCFSPCWNPSSPRCRRWPCQ